MITLKAPTSENYAVPRLPISGEANSLVDFALITTMKQFNRVKHSIHTLNGKNNKLNATENNRLTIISTISK